MATSLAHDHAAGVDNWDGSGQGGRPPAAERHRSSAIKDEPVTKERLLLDEMETPAVVRAMLARLPKMSPVRHKEYEREFKLSYHYEGFTVAVMSTLRGPEIVASGPDEEVLSTLEALTGGERERVTLIEPQSLRAIAKELVVSTPRNSRTDR